MGNVIVDISMSLDGFVTGPSPGIDRGLGVNGEPLHHWARSGQTERDAALINAAVANTGAVLMGRRTFDVVDGPNGWRGDLGYGVERDQSSPPPNFVLTSTPPIQVRLQSSFTFVTEGIHAALEQAQTVADDRDVVVMGGANLAQQYLAAGLVDEVRLHLAPVLLGDGTALFTNLSPGIVELAPVDAVSTPAATHLFYRVVK